MGLDRIFSFRKKDQINEPVRWLSDEERMNYKQTGKSLKGDYVVYMQSEGMVYQEKTYGYLYESQKDCLLQCELFQMLTTKGLFPPKTKWYGFYEDGKYGVASVMPYCVDSPGVKKPYLYEGSGDWTPDIYQEIMQRIDPEFNILVNKTDENYDLAVFWFGLLTPDAWRSDNWREYEGKVYLVDFEGVDSIKDDRRHVLEAINILRSGN